MNCLFHYTSFDCFKSMITGSKERYLTFWASSAYNMDDQIEMNYGYPFIKEVLSVFEAKIKHTHDMRLGDIITKIPKYISKPDEDYFLPKSRTPFVISFSRSYNSDYMWKNYGSKGCGICLLFDADKLYDEARKRESTYLLDVGYYVEKGFDREVWGALLKLVEDQAVLCHTLVPIIDNKKNIQDYKKYILNSLCPIISALIKDESFLQENEVRWISVVDATKKTNHRQRENGLLVEYVNVEIPINCLAGIQVGTSFDYSDELKALCKENGIRLRKSRIIEE